MSISTQDRRSILTAYRFAYNGTPAAAGRQLVDYAIGRNLIGPRRAIPGDTLRAWATSGKPPLWAVRSAAMWLQTHDFLPQDEQQSRAVADAAQI